MGSQQINSDELIAKLLVDDIKAVIVQLAYRTYLLFLVPITRCLIDFVEFKV